MSKTLSLFAPILHQPELWSAQKGTLRCTALRLRDGSLCLYSPVLGMGDVARDSLTALGNVTFLLAPNHYHHKGLAEYVEVFPDAKLVCSEQACSRLKKQTGLSFERLQLLEPLLPDGCKTVEPDGLKTGEVWLTLETSQGLVWIVCDTFKGSSGKAGSIGTHIEILGTFPTHGIKDKGVYATWVEAKLAGKPPMMVVPCHGSIVRSDNLASEIKSLLGP